MREGPTEAERAAKRLGWRVPLLHDAPVWIFHAGLWARATAHRDLDGVWYLAGDGTWRQSPASFRIYPRFDGEPELRYSR